ncbi:MAG: TRL-like family protein [Leptospira sp.]|nr:TRL-like family protein [Leptospira sp.]
MKKIIFFCIGTSFFLTTNCTGINLYRSLLNSGTETNPTPEYSSAFQVVATGGGVFHNNSVPGQLGSNADGKEHGEACQRSVLWLVSWGDSSIETAKQSKKITRISHSEFEQFAILGFVYHSFCTHVFGSTLPIGKIDAPTNIPATATASEKKESR